MNLLDMYTFMEETAGSFNISETGFSETEQMNEVDEVGENLYEHFDVHEVEMMNDIRDVIETDERFKIDNWQEMNLAERENALQELEIKIAQVEQRAPYRVFVDETPGSHGWTRFDLGVIAISEEDALGNSMQSLREVTDTIVHEGRHAYQYENVHGTRTEANEEKFRGWENNFITGYRSAEEYGLPAYLSQPLEADAWAFADATVSSISFR